ncbi:hypothetical protein E8E14_009467 [Neopestalotiopsis sp. 37M]|nr:hypothetical protein E8E14_009467 [Neopestalotiopsis sp. 37M]
MFGAQIVAFDDPSSRDQRGVFSLKGAPIVVDKNDYVGVRIAASNLATDFGRVTDGGASTVLEYETDAVWPHGETAIIVGTLSSSQLIKSLVQSGQLEIDKLQGKWECSQISMVQNPACLSGCHKALVIAGSDKRGAIFGIYSLSEQIGVSPWYWWADVPPKHHNDIFALPIHHTSKEPDVKFRGIFINDEAPALTGWVLEKYGNYGKGFYEKVFELLLRLKANFLWPAMWPGYPNPGSSFFVDDAQNQKLADDWGIVVSTSHHEPMQRATNEWFENNPDGSWSWLDRKDKITQFFRDGIDRADGRESYFTMGMRGEYDKAMKTDDPASVVQDVIQTQRRLIKERYSREDAVPQLLALYKEVQEYWDTGKLDVPDDVTLLFADDNFGSMRRLPSGSETQREGGAGIYYHFEYVGVPRSYKWINSNSLGKIWHQLQEAHRRNARQIWVFNVGDIKPMEIPLTFAMQLAWDINLYSLCDVEAFLLNLATQIFGGTTFENQIASAWQAYDKLMAVRRHEHIEADTFSLLHHQEADHIQAGWEVLLDKVQEIYDNGLTSDPEYKPAFFELVLHPIEASSIYTSLRINLARNQLWAEQRRNSANAAARKVLDLFDADFRLSEEFHSLLDGKWNHLMRQTHYGYKDTWHAPSRDMISGLCFVQSRQDSNPLVGQLGIAVEGHAGFRPGRCNEESDRTHPSRRDLVPGVTLPAMTRYGPLTRWFEIYTRGSIALSWECSCPQEWVRMSKKAGRLVPGQDDERIYVTIDWDQVPAEFHGEILIDVRSIGGNYGPYGDDFEQIHLPIIDRTVKGPFTGHVEIDGYVSAPASSGGSLLDGEGYRVLGYVGRRDTGAVSVDPRVTDPPFLVYDMYTFQDAAHSHLELHFTMTLDVDPAVKMTFDVQIDDGENNTHELVAEPERKGDLPPGWYHAVQDCVWIHRLSIGSIKQGPHKIRLRFRHSNILLENLMLDLGRMPRSYLGPNVDSHVNLT